VAVYTTSGGGTFDACLLRAVTPGQFAPVGVPVGLPNLGGIDFDDAVARSRPGRGSAPRARSSTPADPMVFTALTSVATRVRGRKRPWSTDTSGVRPGDCSVSSPPACGSPVPEFEALNRSRLSRRRSRRWRRPSIRRNSPPANCGSYCSRGDPRGSRWSPQAISARLGAGVRLDRETGPETGCCDGRRSRFRGPAWTRWPPQLHRIQPLRASQSPGEELPIVPGPSDTPYPAGIPAPARPITESDRTARSDRSEPCRRTVAACPMGPSPGWPSRPRSCSGVPADTTGRAVVTADHYRVPRLQQARPSVPAWRSKRPAPVRRPRADQRMTRPRRGREQPSTGRPVAAPAPRVAGNGRIPTLDRADPTLRLEFPRREQPAERPTPGAGPNRTVTQVQ